MEADIKRFYVNQVESGFTVCDRVQCTQTEPFPFIADAYRVADRLNVKVESGETVTTYGWK